jgi:hypothetical protein
MPTTLLSPFPFRKFSIWINKKERPEASLFRDPLGIQNPKYREIILKWFAL